MIMLTSLLAISALVASIVGIEMHPMMFAGAPAATAASCISLAACSVHFAADGCGANTIALRDLIEIIDLKIAVDVGFVEGTIPMIRPIGSAMSMTCATSSALMVPMVFRSLIAFYRTTEAR